MLNGFDMKAMIADYMERGFLDNIVDMFKNDPGLYPLVGDLMTDDRIRVRLGISALVETLAKEDPGNIAASIPSIAGLLQNQNPVIRGDAVYLLGITGHPDAISYLTEALHDEHKEVREIAKEAIEGTESHADNP